MLTLQTTFVYEGDLNVSPLKKLSLKFSCPVFDYQQDEKDNSKIIRKLISSEQVDVMQDLGSSEYYVSFSPRNIIGKDQVAVNNFYKYTVNALTRRTKTIDDFYLKFDIRFTDDDNKTIGSDSIEALYFIKYMNEAGSLGNDHATLRANAVNISAEAARNIFLVNKKIYQDILNELKNDDNPDDELYILDVLQAYTDLRGRKPALRKPDDISQGVLLKRLAGFGDPQMILDHIMNSFEKLFDFPIYLREIKTIDIAGTFFVKMPNTRNLSKDDLSFYELSLEFSSSGQQNANEFHSILFDWLAVPDNIVDNTVAFSFTSETPLIFNSVISPLIIRVKGYDNTVLWSKEYKAENPALAAVQIEVPFQTPNALNPSDKQNTAEINKKIRGQVLELTGVCALNDITIVIQAKKEGDETWRIVAAGKTDKSGNFSIPYPFGLYIKAQAIVSLTPNSPADIPIISDVNKFKTISDDFLYLLIKDADCKKPGKEEDCDCHNPKKATRLPDHADLIGSDEYSQDLGGSCINLSTPNRTLNEYNYKAIVRTSDPDVANYTLNKLTEGRFELVGDQVKIKRSSVDLDNPVRWQDAPDFHENLTIYQSVTVATGHILHYKSEFKADGYSLGDLLYSLALAPGQKKQIVVFDSAHALQGAESQTISQGERLSAGIVDDREITNQLGGSFEEALRGSSSATTSGISAGLGVAGQIGAIGGTLGVAGGYANANSNASQNSSRNISQFFGEKLRQSIMQNADSYRQLNASVVTTVQEGQRYAATTEVIANHNHCHALTMMYFEVLRHYAIFQELTAVEECVFVPLLMTNFSTENIYKWSDILATRLLPMASNTYLQPFSFLSAGRKHPLLKAFDANERIKSNYAHVDFPSGAYDDEKINFVKGEMNIRTNLQRPKTRYDRIKSLPVISKTVTTKEIDPVATAKQMAVDSIVAGASGGLSILFNGPPGSNIQYSATESQTLVKKAIFDQFMQLDANFENVPPAQCIRIINFQPTSIFIPGLGSVPISGADFFENSVIDKNLWTNYSVILGYSSVFNMLDYYFKGRLIAEWDDIYYNDIAPVLFDKIIDTLKIEQIAIDVTSVSKYSGGERVMRIQLNGTTSNKRNQFPQIIKLFSNSPVIKSLKNLVMLTVENVRIYYSTAHYNGLLFSGYVGDDLLDGTDLFIPENSDEKRDPRKEDIYLVNKLIEHLNSNLEYYNKTLWYNLDADRRFMLLDGFNIQIFNDFGLPAGYRSLASVVKNELTTVVGNALVLPVAAGYKVSKSYIVEKNEAGEEVDVTLFDHYKPLTPVPPYRISVPSKGVFLEAVQGQCDACEKVKENSAQDWTKFTTDEPTSIATVTPPVPTITDWKAAFKDFAAPIINIQNAPAEPAPGAGLAGLSELMGKAGVFKDVTGLDANQQNVIRTYLSNQENAKAFAEMAKTMAMQSHNTQNSEKIMDSLKTAKDTGAINQEDYGKLVKDHIQTQIDGGESKKAELEKQKSAKPSLTDAAIQAVDKGKDVKAQKTDNAGNSESIEINSSEPEKTLAQIEGIIPLLKQENANACWATAATMMMSWKKGASLTVQQVLTEAGDLYLQKFNNTQGLKANEKDDFIATLDMVSEPPASYGLQQYIDWLKTYGPLWITTDASEDEDFSPHARILIEITGSGSPDGKDTNFIFYDPATRTQGSESETFLEFIKAFEQMAIDNKSDSLFVQVVHFAEKYKGPAEGFQIQGPWNINNPVHENITLASLLNSTVTVPVGVSLGSDKPTNEFFRGVIWNDDPALLLFDDRKKDNWDFSSGVMWKNRFDKGGKAVTNDLKNLTGRSHYWDLQFLHGMASAVGEDPKDTFAKILLWAEFTYKVAVGEIADTALLSAVPVSSSQISGAVTHTYTINSFFNTLTDPSGSQTVAYLFSRNTKFTGVDNSKRIVGSLLHMIQDSFARGHVKRTLTNPADLVTGSTDQFKPGKYGIYGEIENFHCYKGQDHKMHDKDDTLKGSDPNTLDSFNALLGGRDAIGYCIRVLDFWNTKTSYAAGPKDLFETEIFSLAATATPADTTV